MRFVVWAPPFDWRSGGNIALHKLATLIAARGVPVAVYEESAGAWLRPGLPPLPGLGVDEGVTAADVVVYPEIARGNPLGAARVARWLLNAPGVLGGDTAFDPAEKLFAYAPQFAVPGARPLTVVEPREDLYHKPHPNKLRIDRGCFVVRKGPTPVDSHLTRGADRIPEGAPPEVFARFFQTYRSFHSFDPSTFLSLAAAMCGCRSSVEPVPGMSAEEWRAAHPLLRCGVAYGRSGDEVPRAMFTARDIPAVLAEAASAAETHVDELIRLFRDQ